MKKSRSNLLILTGMLLLAVAFLRIWNSSVEAAFDQVVEVADQAIPMVVSSKSQNEINQARNGLPVNTQPGGDVSNPMEQPKYTPEPGEVFSDEDSIADLDSNFSVLVDSAEFPGKLNSGVHVNGEIPIRIKIHAINLDAPVVPARLQTVKVSGYLFEQWLAPENFAAGWHTTSALLGKPGNTVLNGHHNSNGEVFRRLVDLKEGDEIRVYGENSEFRYRIANWMILPEKYQTLETRKLNSSWINPSDDERLTLVTCWPYETNTHRLVIVAIPIKDS